MPNTNKPSTGNHQGEQLPLILLQMMRRRRSELNYTAASGTTGTELLSDHKGQRSEESKRLFLVSTLTQALELFEDVTDDFCDEHIN
jgi:hypothetical protein